MIMGGAWVRNNLWKEKKKEKFCRKRKRININGDTFFFPSFHHQLQIYKCKCLSCYCIRKVRFQNGMFWKRKWRKLWNSSEVGKEFQKLLFERLVKYFQNHMTFFTIRFLCIYNVCNVRIELFEVSSDWMCKEMKRRKEWSFNWRGFGREGFELFINLKNYHCFR